MIICCCSEVACLALSVILAQLFCTCERNGIRISSVTNLFKLHVCTFWGFSLWNRIVNDLESLRFGKLLLLFSVLNKITFFMIVVLLDMFLAVEIMAMLSHWKLLKIFIEEEFKFWQIQVQTCLHLKQFQISLKLRYPRSFGQSNAKSTLYDFLSVLLKECFC